MAYYIGRMLKRKAVVACDNMKLELMPGGYYMKNGGVQVCMGGWISVHGYVQPLGNLLSYYIEKVLINGDRKM